MKIYTRIVMDWDGQVLEQESFEYYGPISQLKGGGSPPPPTEQETELTEAQAKLVNEQIAQLEKQNELLEEIWPTITDITKAQLKSTETLLPLQEELAKQGIDLQTIQIDALKSEIERNAALEPAILETIGFEKTAEGKYVPTNDIQAKLGERLESALEGKEPISPALESDLQKQEEQLRESLSQRLGPDWETTTPGIQAFNEFQKRADLVREEARQGMITTAGQQYLGHTGLLSGNLMALRGGTPQSLTISPGTSSGLLTGGAGTVGANILGGTTNANTILGNLSSLREQLKEERYEPYLYKQGRYAGRTQAAMGGLIGGGQIGGTVAGIEGAAAGAGIGLLAGYLLG